MAIGWANGAHSNGTSILYGSAGDPIWTYPYEGLLADKVLQLYEQESSRVDIFLENKPTNVQVFGFNEPNNGYANLVMENQFWTLWGFDDGPSKMTETGKRMFVNTAHRAMQ